MGLHTSSAAFVLAMENVFQNKELFHFFYNYVDNLCCCSRTSEDYLRHLKTTFQTLRVKNLRLNPTNSNIGFQEIEFLGFSVSSGGIKISSSKIEAIKTI